MGTLPGSAGGWDGDPPPAGADAPGTWGHPGAVAPRGWGVPVPVPTDLQGLEGGQVSLAAQQDVVGHVEALTDAQVVEEGGLADGVAQLHHGHVCRQDSEDAHRTEARPQIHGAGRNSHPRVWGHLHPLKEGMAPAITAPEATVRGTRLHPGTGLNPEPTLHKTHPF